MSVGEEAIGLVPVGIEIPGNNLEMPQFRTLYAGKRDGVF